MIASYLICKYFIQNKINGFRYIIDIISSFVTLKDLNSYYEEIFFENFILQKVYIDFIAISFRSVLKLLKLHETIKKFKIIKFIL